MKSGIRLLFSYFQTSFWARVEKIVKIGASESCGPRDDTQHEKSRTLIRKENIKFEYKFEIRISKNLTIAYHIKFLKCRSSWFFLQHLFRIFDTNTWIHFVIFSYSTIPLEIINIPIKILVITHTWRQTEKSWRLLLNCEFLALCALCAQMNNFC